MSQTVRTPEDQDYINGPNVKLTPYEGKVFKEDDIHYGVMEFENPDMPDKPKRYFAFFQIKGRFAISIWCADGSKFDKDRCWDIFSSNKVVIEEIYEMGMMRFHIPPPYLSPENQKALYGHFF